MRKRKPISIGITVGERLNDPVVTQAVAALSRGHGLFVGGDAGRGVGRTPALMRARAHGIRQATNAAGLPGGAAKRSGALVTRLHRLANTDRALDSILAEARADRAHASAATRLNLEAAVSDVMPASDTPMGRREAMARMAARLRAQHGHIARSRSQARLLALRLRRLHYLRSHALAGRRDRIGGGSGRASVLAAIRKALDIKGIHDPAARARVGTRHGFGSAPRIKLRPQRRKRLGFQRSQRHSEQRRLAVHRPNVRGVSRAGYLGEHP